MIMKKGVFFLSFLIPLFLLGKGDVLLNDLAIKNSDGAPQVLGDPIGGNYPKEHAFDKVPATFFAPVNKVYGAWAGLAFPEPVQVNKIRYLGRARFGQRMKRCLFQGANDPEFKNPVTLAQADPPVNWNGDSWLEIPTPENKSGFRYLRIASPDKETQNQDGYECGNICELEFYGVIHKDLPEGDCPPPPTLVLAAILNNRLNLQFTAPPFEVHHKLEKRMPDEAGYAPVFDFQESLTLLDGLGYYAGERVMEEVVNGRISANTSGGTSLSLPFAATNYFPMRGRPIGATDAKDLFDGDAWTAYTAREIGERWAGLDFGGSCRLYGIRFLPSELGVRGGHFEISENENFTPCAPFLSLPEDQLYTWEGGIVQITLEEEVSGRYVRFVPAPDAPCQITELEFIAPPETCPMGETLSVSDFETGYRTAKLKWTVPDGSDGVPSVYRSTAPGGPWHFVEELPKGRTEWEDRSAPGGIRFFYQLTYRSEHGGRRLVSQKSLSHVAWQWLDRTPNNPKNLERGVLPCCNPKAGSNFPLNNLFDNNLFNFMQIAPKASVLIRFGIQLDTPHVIKLIRIHSDQNWYPTLFGGNAIGIADDNWQSAPGTAISDTVPQSIQPGWADIPVTREGPWKCAFFQNKSRDIVANEMQIWGYPVPPDPQSTLQPTYLRGSRQGREISLAWEEVPQSEGYRVEVKNALGAWEIRATLGREDGRSFTETIPEGVFGTTCYRITTCKGIQELYSEPFLVSFYKPGNGTGLFRTCHTSFNPEWYNPNGISFPQGIDPVIDFNWGSGEIAKGNADYIRNRWTGRLIVPIEGEYTFTLRSNDGSALWIDGRSIINDWGSGIYDRKRRVFLSEGEHDIRVDHWDWKDEAYCTLLWEGPGIPEEVLPQSQLIPLPPDTLPEPWLGERSFDQSKVGMTRFNPDGSVTLTGGGRDFWDNKEGRHLLWRKISGDFDIRLKYRWHPSNARTTAKLLLMARSKLESGSPLVAASTYLTLNGNSPSPNLECSLREREGENIQGTSSRMKHTEGWLRLVRKGDTFYFFFRDGASAEWHTTSRISYTAERGTFPPELFAGPAVTSTTEDLESFTLSKMSAEALSGAPLLPPAEIIFTPLDGIPTLSWSETPGAEGYRIQRKTTGGEWVTVAENQPGTRYSHPDNLPNGQLPVYRVGSIRGEDVICSSEISFQFDQGNGTGLHAVYRYPHLVNGYDPAEQVVATKVDPQIAFFSRIWGSGDLIPGIKDLVGVTWSGKLIVPYTSNWTFNFESDDGVALWIDGQPVINQGWDVTLPRDKLTGSIRLSCGLHPIRIDYSEETGNAYCVLRWKSDILNHDSITPSQLIPNPDRLPPPWQGERTFNQKRKGGIFFKDEGKTAEFWCGGGDYFNTSDARHQIWSSWVGNFDLSMRFRWHAPAQDRGAWPKLMLMARESLQIGSPSWVICVQNQVDKHCFVTRWHPGWDVPMEEADYRTCGIEGEMRLVRRGNKIVFYVRNSKEESWSLIGTPYTGELPDRLLIGPAVSTNSDTLQHYTVSELTLEKGGEGTLLILE